jgi:hypothetical protein
MKYAICTILLMGCIEGGDTGRPCGESAEWSTRCDPDVGGGVSDVQICAGGQWDTIFHCPSRFLTLDGDFGGACLGGHCVPLGNVNDNRWPLAMDCALGGSEALIDGRRYDAGECCETYYTQNRADDDLIDEYLCNNWPDDYCATNWEGSPC